MYPTVVFLAKLNKNLPICLHSKFPFQSACMISRILFSVTSSFLFSEAVSYQKRAGCHFFFMKRGFACHNDEVNNIWSSNENMLQST